MTNESAHIQGTALEFNKNTVYKIRALLKLSKTLNNIKKINVLIVNKEY